MYFYLHINLYIFLFVLPTHIHQNLTIIYPVISRQLQIVTAILHSTLTHGEGYDIRDSSCILASIDSIVK